MSGPSGKPSATHRTRSNRQRQARNGRWLNAFYDQAELESLALAAYLSLGSYEDAEAHAHRSLARLRPEMQRTRAITTACLAKAQLGQGEIEPAVSTAMSIASDPADQHPCVSSMLQDFGNALRIAAPSSAPRWCGTSTATTPGGACSEDRAAPRHRHRRGVEHLIDVYAEVRADRLHEPHYSVERYGERLARHASEPGWEAVVGFDGERLVGYAYVNTLQTDDRWWRRMTTPLPRGCTDTATVALKEITLRVPWWGTGVARRISTRSARRSRRPTA